MFTICRLYDSYGDASRVVLALEAAGAPRSETSLVSNNSDTWYSAPKTAGATPGRGDRTRDANGKLEGAGWLAAMLSSMAIGGVAGGLLGALTNAGISEQEAQVFVEGVRRGGTLVVARVQQSELPRIEATMNQSAVKLQERCELYRNSGWQCFDPNAVPYTADQVRSERALHAH